MVRRRCAGGPRRRLHWKCGERPGPRCHRNGFHTGERLPASVTVGDYTSVGAGSCLKSCVVEHTVDIGEGCVIDQGAVVQNTVVLEPGSVVPAGALITSGGRWAGNPASLVAPLPEEAAADIVAKAEAKESRPARLMQSTTRRPARPERRRYRVNSGIIVLSGEAVCSGPRDTHGGSVPVPRQQAEDEEEQVEDVEVESVIDAPGCGRRSRAAP